MNDSGALFRSPDLFALVPTSFQEFRRQRKNKLDSQTG